MMLVSTPIWALVSITLSVAAQFFLKSATHSIIIKEALNGELNFSKTLMILTNFHLIIGFIFYGLSAIIWLQVLTKWDVSKAYPLVGFGFGMALVVGFFMGEAITVTRLIGVSFVCIGIYIIGWKS
jgi:multidrug transporter EmrE-like cation transporter